MVKEITKRSRILERKEIKIGFWNIEGLMQKINNPQFDKYIKEFDIIIMMETFVEEKHWRKLKKQLPEEFNWDPQYAWREHASGRGIGGIITGIRHEIDEIKEEEDDRKEPEGIKIKRVKLGKESWTIVSIYNRKKGIGTTEIMKTVKKLIPEEKEGNLLIGGDFNARIGLEGTMIWGAGRKSKDKVINTEGRKFLTEIVERAWDMLNGNIEGDEEGEYTHIGANGDRSVIDYVITNVETREKIHRMVVEERTESDHLPLCVYIQPENKL